MKCEEMLAVLNEYVDGELDPSICEFFDEHMKDCNPCQIVVDNIRQTIQLFNAGEPIEMPVACQQRLRDTLRGRWKKAPPSTDH
ncbi:MAG: zf-HC2 domain-containing protein [Planctomycetes bacterium]|nr:zf-HC2 domain-containing protein [Planctomycetota bacterium]